VSRSLCALLASDRTCQLAGNVPALWREYSAAHRSGSLASRCARRIRCQASSPLGVVPFQAEGESTGREVLVATTWEWGRW
jgi:hypothetical protein